MMIRVEIIRRLQKEKLLPIETQPEPHYIHLAAIFTFSPSCLILLYFFAVICLIFFFSIPFVKETEVEHFNSTPLASFKF